MNKETITLHRHNAPDWVFEWDESFCGMIYKTRHNTYQLFMDGFEEIKPIWIGRLSHDCKAWYTVEKEIKAKCIQLVGCSVIFT